MRYILWVIGLAVLVLIANWAYQSGRSPANTGSSTQTVKVYFSENQPTEIVQVAVDREVLASSDIEKLAGSAIIAMLGGPTDEERAQGLLTAIQDGSHMNYVRIKDGIATVDFNEAFDFQLGGSAKVLAIRGQVEKTLMQFAGVDEVKITINNGEREAVLEP